MFRRDLHILRKNWKQYVTIVLGLAKVDPSFNFRFLFDGQHIFILLVKINSYMSVVPQKWVFNA